METRRCEKDETPSLLSLSKLKKGQMAKVVDIKTESRKLRQRFLDMGITKCVVVKVKSVAPFGSPITLELRDYELSVRKADLDNIIVELIS
ncbi:MAG: FeoA family protein [Acholeplasmataceae bacterium]|jgi:ferrous iron transport protein A